MGYLGRQPSVGRFARLDDLTASFDSACTTFSLTESSVAVIPGAASNLIVSLGGVLQEPETAYTVNGSSIIFSSAPANTQPFFAILLGDVLDVGTLTSGVAINVASIGIGSNVTMNTSALFVGNSTINVIHTGSSLTVGANVAANTTALFVGNSTVNVIHTGSSLTIGANVTANTSTLFVGNSSVNTAITAGVITLSGVTVGGGDGDQTVLATQIFGGR